MLKYLLLGYDRWIIQKSRTLDRTVTGLSLCLFSNTND